MSQSIIKPKRPTGPGWRLSGYECTCTEHEPAMVEDKGDFVWLGVTR